MNELPSSSHSLSEADASNEAQTQSKSALQKSTLQEISTTLEVLSQLAERLNAEASASIIQLPKTKLGTRYAASIGRRTMEQTGRIKNISAALIKWRDELSAQTTLGDSTETSR